MLDIIVPHYREPWTIGKKLFDMLGLQRGIDFSALRVILVNDGPENRLDDGLFADYPYRVDQCSIDHAGVGAARNEGLRRAIADWVAFCDFDDTYAHIYALRDVMEHLPTDQFDLLWTKCLNEDGWTAPGRLILHQRKEQDVVFCHGKYYRRQFLLDNDIWFPTDMTFQEDSLFNATVTAYIHDPHRMGELKGVMPDYVWCYRPDSTTTAGGRRAEAMQCTYLRQKRLCEVHRKVLPGDRYDGQVARTIWDAYHMLNRDHLGPGLLAMREDFRKWYAEHADSYERVDEEMMKRIRRISYLEQIAEKEVEIQRHGQDPEIGRFRDEVGLTQWLLNLNTTNESENESK